MTEWIAIRDGVIEVPRMAPETLRDVAAAFVRLAEHIESGRPSEGKRYVVPVAYSDVRR